MVCLCRFYTKRSHFFFFFTFLTICTRSAPSTALQKSTSTTLGAPSTAPADKVSE